MVLPEAISANISETIGVEKNLSGQEIRFLNFILMVDFTISRTIFMKNPINIEKMNKIQSVNYSYLKKAWNHMKNYLEKKI